MKSDNDIVKRLVECRTDYDDALMPDRAEPIGCDCGLLREAGEEIERLRRQSVEWELVVEGAIAALAGTPGVGYFSATASALRKTIAAAIEAVKLE